LLPLVVDLDLAQVRAFVAVAEEQHFGRGAERLGISQQAVSKRVARLERQLVVKLFERNAYGATLSEAGREFLGPARRVLLAGDAAVAAVMGETGPLRVDVWGHLFGPLRTVRAALDDDPGLPVEVGRARDFPSVITALRRGELDAGFGRVHALGEPWEDSLARRLIRLEPVDAVLGAGHPLASADELRPADLRGSVVWFPAEFERLDFLRAFCERFEIASRDGGPNLGLDALLDALAGSPGLVTLLPADLVLPDRADVRTIPLTDPTPLYAWSLVWRRADTGPRLSGLLDLFAAVGQRNRWLEYDPSRDWLPASAT
jgi:DNA-binding transcriptional LysR family regulator